MTQKLMKHLYLLCITLLIPLSLTAQTPDTPQPDEIADSLLLARTNTDSISTADTTSAAWSHLVQDRLAQLISNPIFERTQLGLCVYDLTADSVLFSHGERQLLRPASCEKVLTAIAALSQLGGSHRFETRLYYQGDITDRRSLEGDIYIVGGFDPRFGHDDLHALCEALRELNIDSISGNVYLDVSMKDTASKGSGWCWDDETIRLTPLLFNGKDTFLPHLIQALNESSLKVKGQIGLLRKLPGDVRFVANRFHTIDQILMRMLKQSDNLYAEAVFYQLGAQSRVSYASWKYSADCVNRFINELNLNPRHYQIADGSGLSLYNYVTPQLLVQALRYAWQRNNIYLHLYPALPIAGRDGTLRSRMRNSSARNNVHAKTGTVEGVSTLAGYATAPNGHILCFAIMNQGLRYHSTGRNFQDRVCQVITQP